jgi:hypothetical protein
MIFFSLLMIESDISSRLLYFQLLHIFSEIIAISISIARYCDEFLFDIFLRY